MTAPEISPEDQAWIDEGSDDPQRLNPYQPGDVLIVPRGSIGMQEVEENGNMIHRYWGNDADLNIEVIAVHHAVRSITSNGVRLRKPCLVEFENEDGRHILVMVNENIIAINEEQGYQLQEEESDNV